MLLGEPSNQGQGSLFKFTTIVLKQSVRMKFLFSGYNNHKHQEDKLVRKREAKKVDETAQTFKYSNNL